MIRITEQLHLFTMKRQMFVQIVNLLFWILNLIFFFKIMVGEALHPLTTRHVTVHKYLPTMAFMHTFVVSTL